MNSLPTKADTDSPSAYMTICPLPVWVLLCPTLCDQKDDQGRPRAPKVKENAFHGLVNVALCQLTLCYRVVGHLADAENGIVDFNGA